MKMKEVKDVLYSLRGSCPKSECIEKGDYIKAIHRILSAA